MQLQVDDADPYMPLSTIERPRPVLGSSAGPTPLLSHSAAHSAHSNPYSTTARTRTTNIHTPPQTPPYHGTMNGGGMPPHVGAMSNSPYGHLGASSAAAAGGVPQRQLMQHHNHMVGTLGRNGAAPPHQQ